MTGHDCDECHATIPQCDEHIRLHGEGCCGACFARDTHGLLKVVDLDQQQQIENLNRLVAQMVIARSEHANAIRRLRAEVGSISEALARIEGKLERTEAGEKTRLLNEVLTEARTVVRNLPERVRELEDVAGALETHLGLHRRPKAQRAPRP